jgi:hypothetical protein
VLFARPRDSLRPVFDAQLIEYLSVVPLDRAESQKELLGDLSVRESIRNEP